MRQFRESAATVLIGLFVGSIWLASVWPGRLSADSLASVEQIKSGQFSAWHPVPYTLFIKVTSFDLKFLGLTSIVQVALMAWAAQQLLQSFGLSVRRQRVLVALFMATPFGGAFAQTLWKDVLATVLLSLGLAFSIKYLTAFSSRKLWVSLAFFSLAGAMRYNIPPTLAAAAALVGLFGWIFRLHSAAMRLATALCAAAVVGVGMQGAANELVAAEPAPSHFSYAPLIADVAFVASVDPKAPITLTEALGSFSEAQSRDGAAYCASINPLFFNPGFDSRAADSVAERIFPLWIEAVRSAPLLVLKSHYCKASVFLPPPFGWPTGWAYWIHPGIDPNSLGIQAGSLAGLGEAMNRWLSIWIGQARYVAWPGLWLLITGCVLWRVRRRLALLIPIASLLTANVVALLVYAPAPDFRYAAVVQMVGVLALMAVLDGRFREPT